METSRTACIAAAASRAGSRRSAASTETPRRERTPPPEAASPAPPPARRRSARMGSPDRDRRARPSCSWSSPGAVASYVSLGRASRRRQRAPAARSRSTQSGLILNEPTTTLLLGTDHGPGAGREGARRTDSMLLVRTDPERGRTSFLSIPRDLRVEVPGQGFAKINAAYQSAGPDLAIRTIRDFSGCAPSPRRGRRLRRLRAPDRRARRGDRRRARADRLEPVRLPVLDRERCALGAAGGSPRASRR